MARKRSKAYPLEFRQKVVGLAQSGRLPDDLAAEFEVARQTVRNWIKQSDLDGGERIESNWRQSRKTYGVRASKLIFAMKFMSVTNESRD